MRYARVTDGIVAEIIALPDDVELADAFHPDLVEAIHVCSDDVEEGWSYDGKTFEAPIETVIPLDDLKTDRIAALTVACAAAIVGGFQSQALTAPHTYPSSITDQINLMGSVTASLLPGLDADWTTPFWCADGAAVWQFRMHTAAQIQQAGSDGKGHVVTCQGTLDALSAAVMGADTKAEVDAISWPSAGA